MERYGHFVNQLQVIIISHSFSPHIGLQVCVVIFLDVSLVPFFLFTKFHRIFLRPEYTNLTKLISIPNLILTKIHGVNLQI